MTRSRLRTVAALLAALLVLAVLLVGLLVWDTTRPSPEVVGLTADLAATAPLVR